MLTNTKAMDSAKMKGKCLIDQGVFDLSVIREYYDVAREAKQKNEEVHMARAHVIIVEKHSQLSEEPRRKYKGRGVVPGSQIKNHTSDAALFQDLGNSPATFEASRWTFQVALTDGMCRWLMRYKHISRPLCGEHLDGSSFQPKQFLKTRGSFGEGFVRSSVTYDMEQFLRSCVDRYLEVAGNVELKKVPTPGPHEETKDHTSRAPIQTGLSVECNWCGNRVPANGYETPSCQAGGTSEGAHPETTRTSCGKCAHENIVWC